MTLKQVADAAGYGESTISELETKGSGSARLKLRLREVYARMKSSAYESESESVIAPLAAREGIGESDLTIWKRRAQSAEQKLENLRNAMRSLIELSSNTPPPRELSLTPPSEAEKTERQ